MHDTPASSPPTRLPAIEPKHYSVAQRDAADRLASGPRGELRGPFVPMLHSPAFLDRAQQLGEYLRFGCLIPQRPRELAILIAARHWSQAYEWHVHAPLAARAGVTPATLTALANGETPSSLTADEQAVYDFCTELHRRQNVSDAGYAAAQARFGHAGIVDLCGLCGYYAMLAMLLNVAGRPLPDGATPFAVPQAP
ncbi:MAG: carboxymuconolactone decarboxylase family protein [Solimonas sp.]